MDLITALSREQQAMIPIAAYTASVELAGVYWTEV